MSNTEGKVFRNGLVFYHCRTIILKVTKCFHWFSQYPVQVIFFHFLPELYKHPRSFSTGLTHFWFTNTKATPNRCKKIDEGQVVELYWNSKMLNCGIVSPHANMYLCYLSLSSQFFSPLSSYGNSRLRYASWHSAKTSFSAGKPSSSKY